MAKIQSIQIPETESFISKIELMHKLFERTDFCEFDQIMLEIIVDEMVIAGHPLSIDCVLDFIKGQLKKVDANRSAYDAIRKNRIAIAVTMDPDYYEKLTTPLITSLERMQISL